MTDDQSTNTPSIPQAQMKDAYYFQHDANARHDPKLLMLVKECGMSGIGRWWCLVEILREQEHYCFDIAEKHNLKALKHELDFENEAELLQFLEELVELCLIRRLEGKILSPALIQRMQRLDAKREERGEIARKAGLASGEKRRAKKAAPAFEHTLNTRSTSVPQSNARSTSVQHPLEKTNHLSTYLPTNVPTYSGDTSTHKGDVSPEGLPKKFDERTLTIPDTEHLYIYPSTFAHIPVGTYFVPVYEAHDSAEKKVFIKYNEQECLSAKEKIYYTIKEAQHAVLTYEEYQ